MREVVENGVRKTLYEKDGEERTLYEWSAVLGVSYKTLKTRHRRHRGEADKVLVEFDRREKPLTHEGRTMNMASWARFYEVDKTTFCAVVKHHGADWAFDFYDTDKSIRRHGGGFPAKKFIEVDGNRMSLRDASIVYGVPLGRVRSRAYHNTVGRDGTSGAEAIVCTGRLSERYLTFHGERRSVGEWGKESGLGKCCVASRLKVRGATESVIDEPKARKRNEQSALSAELGILGVVS